MTAAEIAARLAQCRKDWLPSVFSAGRIERGVFLLGNAEGSAGRSLPVPLNPSRRRLVDFASDWRGDDLALWATAKRLTPGEAYQDAKRWLGLWDEGTGSAVTIPRPAEQPPPLLVDPYDHADYERDHHNRELAQETWRQTERIRRSRDAMDYLVIRRGITDWDDDRLRWHPACPWGRGHVGCIVVPVTSHVTGYTVAIWRIRPSMTEPMAGRRAGLGPVRGNAARLFWTDGDRVAIAEGVEDALALYALTGWPSWAALSASGMAGLVLPWRIRRVLICQDADPPDRNGRRPGPEAAQALAQRLRAEGREVEIVQARGAKDPNALLQQGTAP